MCCVAGLIRYHGTVLTWRTHLHFLSLLKGISISLIGLSTTSWHETDKSWTQIEHNDSTGCTEPVQIQYGASKTHIEQTQQLAESLILPRGSTQLGSFEFQLPDFVPGSCRLPHGSIDYRLQVSLERRGKCVKCFQHRLIVRNRIELLELRPALSECSAFSLSVPRSVFVPGQRVAYHLEANCTVQLVTRLLQCITYVSQQPLVKVKKVVRVLDESCELEDALHLPLTAPFMMLMPDELIEISYYLETLSDGSETLSVPLFVGTVAPPVDSTQLQVNQTCPSLGFVNLGKCPYLLCLSAPLLSHFNFYSLKALCENELLFSTINQLLQPHSCSREINVSSIAAKHSERLKLLRHQKKQSYVRLALRFFYKRLLPAN